MQRGKRVICISWNESLAITRQFLLGSIGCRVVSALGEREGLDSCRQTANLMILGHSVPRTEKRSFINCFRQHSTAPVLSLLGAGQDKLLEASVGLESGDPQEFLRTVKQILG